MCSGRLKDRIFKISVADLRKKTCANASKDLFVIVQVNLMGHAAMLDHSASVNIKMTFRMFASKNI